MWRCWSGAVGRKCIFLYVLFLIKLLLFVPCINTNNQSMHLHHQSSSFNTKSNTSTTTHSNRNNNNSKMDMHNFECFEVLRRLWSEIRSARTSIKEQFEPIKLFYAPVRQALRLNRVGASSWLPNDHLQWYLNHEKLRHLNRHKKVVILLPLLNSSLYNFSITFNSMNNYGSKQFLINHSAYQMRNSILQDVTRHLDSIQNEMSAALTVYKLPNKNMNWSLKEQENWDNDPDHTNLMIQDWGVLTIYYRFLKDWLKILYKILDEYLKALKCGHLCKHNI